MDGVLETTAGLKAESVSHAGKKAIAAMPTPADGFVYATVPDFEITRVGTGRSAG
jgi:hypothetical protein